MLYYKFITGTGYIKIRQRKRNIRQSVGYIVIRSLLLHDSKLPPSNHIFSLHGMGSLHQKSHYFLSGMARLRLKTIGYGHPHPKIQCGNPPALNKACLSDII